MNRTGLVEVFLVVLLSASPDVATADSFKVMSFNILADSLEGPRDAWLDPVHPRRDRVGAILLQEDADVFGLQEVTPNQLADLINFLPDYDYLSRAGSVGGNVIFYRRDRFQFQNGGSLFLPSPARIGAWTQLQDTTTSQSFVVFGLHFFGDTATKVSQAAEFQANVPAIAGDLPVILTGDFNFPLYEGSVTDEFLEVSGRSGTQNRFLVDAGTPLMGNTPSGSNLKRIDYVVNTDDFEVTDAQVVTTLIDGLRPSDHRPVTAQLSFTPAGSDRRRWAVQSHVVYDVNTSGSPSDGIGDSFRQVTLSPEWFIGHHPQADYRFVMKFTVPEVTDEATDIHRATLRIYVNDVIGTLPDGLDLMHSSEDNGFQAVASDYESPYADTGLDLIVAPGGAGRYYEFDVTEFVRADMMAGESIPLTAFRLQLGSEQQIDPTQRNGYDIDTKYFAPQLVITFVPEPTALTTALLAFLGFLSSSRRRRGYAEASAPDRLYLN